MKALKGGEESASAGENATVHVSKKLEQKEKHPRRKAYDGTLADKRSVIPADSASRASDHVFHHRLSSVPDIRKTLIFDSTAVFQDAGKSLQFLCNRGRARV